MTAIPIIETASPLDDPRVRQLRDRLRGGGLTAAGDGSLDVPAIVRDIVADVADRGDEALVALAERLDDVQMTPDELRVPVSLLEAAHGAADAEFMALARRVVQNIRDYQRHIRLEAPASLRRGGRRLGVRYTPIERVGVYVPGGKAMYPSTVLMTVVPALVAGVKEIVLVSPPTDDAVNPMVMALAAELDIREVYRVGGAQAIAALALGTQRIRPVHKIVGPGNAFVAEAKRQLFGRVAIDSIAGPSEVLILADDTAPDDWVAADLLAQAEHNPGSAILVTPSATLAKNVLRELERQLAQLDRADETRQALAAYSGIIVTPDLDAAIAVVNDFATEHLEIVTADDEAVLERVRNAGAIFLGPHTPVPVGDYYAGPSHVLPTGGTARYFGALSVNDFLKASSVIHYDEAGLAEDATDIADFATREGLTAHAWAVLIRGQDVVE